MFICPTANTNASTMSKIYSLSRLSPFTQCSTTTLAIARAPRASQNSSRLAARRCEMNGADILRSECEMCLFALYRRRAFADRHNLRSTTHCAPMDRNERLLTMLNLVALCPSLVLLLINVSYYFRDASCRFLSLLVWLFCLLTARRVYVSVCFGLFPVSRCFLDWAVYERGRDWAGGRFLRQATMLSSTCCWCLLCDIVSL